MRTQLARTKKKHNTGDTMLHREKKAEEMYHGILALARKKYNGDGEDVAHEAWLIAQGRGYFHPRMLDEAARRLGIFRTKYTAEHTILLPPGLKTAGRMPVQNKKTGSFERLVAITKNTRDPRIPAVIRDVLAGEGICVACTRNGISYVRFIAECRRAAVQPSLFGERRAA